MVHVNRRGIKSPVLEGEHQGDPRGYPREQPAKSLAQNTTPPIADVGLALPLADGIPDKQILSMSQKQ